MNGRLLWRTVGINDGRGFVFVSHTGEIYPSGFLPISGGNVRNDSLIDNLPHGCVEVACLVDKRGIQPCHFGPLPEQCAALNRQHMAVHELMVRSLLEQDREAALHALQLDPLTAAVCSLAEIRSMFDEMWAAEQDFLPDY